MYFVFDNVLKQYVFFQSLEKCLIKDKMLTLQLLFTEI